MEGPYLKKWGAKHIFLFTVGGPDPKQCTLRIQSLIQGPSIFCSRYDKIGVYSQTCFKRPPSGSYESGHI